MGVSDNPLRNLDQTQPPNDDDERHGRKTEGGAGAGSGTRDYIGQIYSLVPSNHPNLATTRTSSSLSSSSSHVLVGHPRLPINLNYEKTPTASHHLVSLIWKHIDPRKPNRERKLKERARTKLESATSLQVHQILSLNNLLKTLNEYQTTLDRFQGNSSRLHRCLIKWDKLKSRDQSFTRTSMILSLDLQRFIEQMSVYFGNFGPHRTIEEEEEEAETAAAEEEEETQNGEEGDEQRVRPEVHVHTDITTTEEENQSLVELDEGFVEVGRPRPVTQTMGIRKQVLMKYRLGQLRFKTRKFNQQFEIHEQKKIDLKFRGNQCIIEMVKDGKRLLEINEVLIENVFELSLLRNRNRRS